MDNDCRRISWISALLSHSYCREQLWNSDVWQRLPDSVISWSRSMRRCCHVCLGSYSSRLRHYMLSVFHYESVLHQQTLASNLCTSGYCRPTCKNNEKENQLNTMFADSILHLVVFLTDVVWINMVFSAYSVMQNIVLGSLFHCVGIVFEVSWLYMIGHSIASQPFFRWTWVSWLPLHPEGHSSFLAF